jgi:F-type H+-transporting ATPase subunit epsilon
MTETKIIVRIVTPDDIIFEGTATRIRVCGLKEYYTILPRHAPMVELLSAGEIYIESIDQKDIYIGIDGGILEVVDNVVNVLSQEAIVSSEKGTAMASMKHRKEERKNQVSKSREKLIKSEMELYRLLRQANQR